MPPEERQVADYERLRQENERLLYEQDEMDRAVRAYESAKDPVVWADRPDINWCKGCDQYHRTDYEHLLEDGWRPTCGGRLWKIETDQLGNLVHHFIDPDLIGGPQETGHAWHQ